MFLRAKDGMYAGQIREYSPEAARQLLAAGRAENPYAEPARSVPKKDAPVVEPERKRSRKRNHGRN